MCTVTIAPILDFKRVGTRTIRIVCNRDESRLRPIAAPPTVERFGSRQAILPRDPQAGGTWIAANDAGLAFVLLNATSVHDEAIGDSTSRGTIIPGLLESESLDEATNLASRMDATCFHPFRLVILDRTNVVELARDHSRLVMRECSSTSSPRLFTSSGLGDELVAGPRRELFREHFATGRDWRVQQDEFHRHRWSNREHVSVLMRRPDAQTVSRTEIALENERVLLSYYELSEGEQVSPVSLELSPSKGPE